MTARVNRRSVSRRIAIVALAFTALTQTTRANDPHLQFFGFFVGSIAGTGSIGEQRGFVNFTAAVDFKADDAAQQANKAKAAGMKLLVGFPDENFNAFVTAALPFKDDILAVLIFDDVNCGGFGNTHPWNEGMAIAEARIAQIHSALGVPTLIDYNGNPDLCPTTFRFPTGLDYVSVETYGANGGDAIQHKALWITMVEELKSYMNGSQKLFLMPAATDGYYGNPVSTIIQHINDVYAFAQNDPKVAGLFPFLWYSYQYDCAAVGVECGGGVPEGNYSIPVIGERAVRDSPPLKARFIEIGHEFPFFPANGISLTAPGVSVNEYAGAAPLGVRLTTPDELPSQFAASVQYATTNGTAVAGIDYAAAPPGATLTFPAGWVSGDAKTITVPIINDALDEDDETFTVTLSSPSGGRLGTAVATVTILDDDPPPALSIGSVSVAEGNAGTTTVLFPVSLSAASGRTVTVHYATADGTATTADVDYAAASATVTFAPGTTAQTIPIVVYGDTVYEPDETFTVTLSSPVFATIGQGTGTGTITNDDVNCTITLDPPSRVIDPGVSGNANLDGTVSVTLAQSSCPWTAVSQSGWLTVPANAGATGNGSFWYTAAQNASASARTGFVTVGYRTFMLTQPGTAAPGTVIHVADTFTGANGTAITAHSPDVYPAGVTWTATGSPTPTLSGGRIVAGAGSDVVLATVDAGVADVSLGVDWLVGTGPRAWGGLVLRVSDMNNQLRLRYSQGVLALIRRQNGTVTVIGSQAVPVLHPGSAHRIEARTHADVIQVLWDGVLAFQVSESFQQTLTRHGLAWYPPDDPDSAFDNVELVGENRAPVVSNPGAQTSAEAASVTLPIGATDPDGGVVACSATGLPAGLAMNPVSCVISGTLTYTGAGTYTTTVTATDDGGLSTSVAFAWTVANTNRPPTLTSPANQITLANSVVSLQLIGSDPDGDPLTYSATGLPPFLSLNAATGLISGTLSSAGGYVVTAIVSDGSLSASKTFTWAVTRRPAGDFDGDNKTDMTVFRPSTGGWYSLYSSTNYTTSSAWVWGIGTDKPVAGDYDGDGKIDPAIFRPSSGLWAILYSSTNYTTSTTVSWGIGSDVPAPADYDGDGKVDPAIYRPSTGLWAILRSSSNYTTSSYATWGLSTDLPVPGDYDGDGQADPAVYRPSTGQWTILYSSANYTTSVTLTWGLSTDVPVPGDYDGDGKIDPAVFRTSNAQWVILYSSTGYTTSLAVTWGAGTDTPVPGDYDGDGKADPAIFRNGLWAYLHSNTTYTSSFFVTWGVGSDIAILRRP